MSIQVGDAAVRPAQRLHHPIGKLLAAVGHGDALGTALQVGFPTEHAIISGYIIYAAGA